ncbi:uncharacterized protein LOC121874321 [Homarus americanus]|uniref:uncharacterized protein LOC121874321 n=1 Tax=Homarus americanus TaxID=6706 RepID=UPI001C4697A5|nr:uncharacterized protein LOC121874321 [Homarus americanus]
MSFRVESLDCKSANVTPVHKKGMKSAAKNYRPISRASHIRKLLETILKDAIIQHLSEHSLINASQHGFMERKSCLKNLLTLLETITDYLDQSLVVDVLYMDFSKTFVKVPHARLASKIQVYVITGKILKWINSWLEDSLEYCTQAWNPYPKKDLTSLEKVQHIATEMIPELCHLHNPA